MDFEIKVFNAGQKIFEGAADYFLEMNENNKKLKELIKDCCENGRSVFNTMSGKWILIKN